MKELDQLVENFFQPKRDTLGLDQLVEMVEELMEEQERKPQSFQRRNFPAEGNEQYSDAGVRTDYASKKGVFYPLLKKATLFQISEDPEGEKKFEFTELDQGTEVEFIQPPKLFSGADLGFEKGNAKRATFSRVMTKSGTEGYLSITTIQKPPGKTQSRVAAGSAAQDIVFDIISEEAMQNNIDIKKISSAPMGSTKPDLVVEYGGEEIQFEIKGRNSSGSEITFFDKSAQRKKITPEILDAIAKGYIEGLKLAIAEKDRNFKTLMDYYRKLDSSVGYAGDEGVVKSGKLPKELATTNPDILNNVRDNVVKHLRESGDDYFVVYTRDEETADIYSTGTGKNPLEANPVPNFKRAKLATYGGVSSGSTRVGFKIILDKVDSNIPDKPENNT